MKLNIAMAVLCGLILLGFTGAVIAGGPPLSGVGAFATVTFTRPSGEVWVDSGIIVEDHQYSAGRGVGGYTDRFVVFPDHVNQYHLDEGRVDIVWGR